MLFEDSIFPVEDFPGWTTHSARDVDRTEALQGTCEGCEKGKSKRLPFPALQSRAKQPLDLVHSNLDKMPVLSICGYKYTTTYLDNYSSFGVMFYLKHKNKEFTAFKTYKAWAKRQLGTTLKCRQFNWGGEFLSNEQKAYMAENRIEYQTSIPDSPQQNGWAEMFQQTIINGAEAMRHHAGLSNSFWIYAVKATLHTYNVTPIKWADYKTPKELWLGIKPNMSHLQVFSCQAWVHILKKRRHKLEPKSEEMIFVSYKPGSKGYQFWDAAHWRFKISHDVKFEETVFPAKETKLAQPALVPLSNHQFSESDNESDSLGLDLVDLAQPPNRPPSPGQSALGPPAQPSQGAGPQPPHRAPWVSNAPLPPDMGTAPLQPTAPWYLLHQTKARDQQQCIDSYVPRSSKFLPGSYEFTG